MKSSRDNVLQLPLNRLKSFPDFPFSVGDEKGCSNWLTAYELLVLP